MMGIDVNGLKIEPARQAGRVCDQPWEVIGWQSVGAASGAMTGIVVNAPVFSLRNISTKLLLVRRVGIGFVVATGFTAAQHVSFGLAVARAFTASDAAGTAIALTGSNAKHRTVLATPSSLDMRISAAAALTAGTRTLDANDIGMQGGWAAAATAGQIIAPSMNNLLSHDTGDYPLVLAQNEGLIISARDALGAVGVGRLYVNIEFAEADTY
jgi:hypothetical protein